jgi:hypothetical protein
MSTTRFKQIYEGHYKDLSPDLRSAGILIDPGERIQPCINPELHMTRPTSPHSVRKFRDTYRPAPAERRVFYGVADDTRRTRAFNVLRHGVLTKESQDAGEVIYPQLLSRFTNHQKSSAEGIYFSNQKAPLGVSHDQKPGLPEGLDPLTKTMGVKYTSGEGAKPLINPDMNEMQVEDKHIQGHDLYVKSHNSYYVCEHQNRKYDHNFEPKDLRGKPSPHDNTGKTIKRSMDWVTDTMAKTATPMVNKRVDDFRERSQHQIGQVHDPIKTTIEHMSKDHVYGLLIKPDPYGAGDVIHDRLQSMKGLMRQDDGYVGKAKPERELLRGKDRARGLVALVQHQLKKLNYQKYDTLWKAFQDYDKDKSGFIEKEELAAACSGAGFELEEELINALTKECGGDAHGRINFQAFVNFLNWKDYLPNGQSGKEYEKVENLTKSIDPAPWGYDTSAMKIKSTIGDPDSLDTREWRRYGVPTIRADIPAPRFRRISDRLNYGDQANAYGLIHPTIYATRGVHERDFFKPRSKEEIYNLFTKINVKLDEATFSKSWEKAMSLHPKGDVSVESFRTALDQQSQEAMAAEAIAI